MFSAEQRLWLLPRILSPPRRSFEMIAASKSLCEGEGLGDKIKNDMCPREMDFTFGPGCGTCRAYASESDGELLSLGGIISQQVRQRSSSDVLHCFAEFVAAICGRANGRVSLPVRLVGVPRVRLGNPVGCMWCLKWSLLCALCKCQVASPWLLFCVFSMEQCMESWLCLSSQLPLLCRRHSHAGTCFRQKRVRMKTRVKTPQKPRRRLRGQNLCLLNWSTPGISILFLKGNHVRLVNPMLR